MHKGPGRRETIFLWVLLLPLLPACGRHRLRPDETERNRLFAEILRREDRRALGSDDFLRTNLLGSPYPEVREWCAIALGRIGLPQALPWLYEACRTGSASVRAAAAFAVGEIEDRDQLKEQGLSPDPRAADELARLLDDASPSVQMRAVEALGKAGSANEAMAIARRLESFPHDASPGRLAWLDLCVTALVRLKDRAALSSLEKLVSAGGPEIQWRAANALIRLRDSSACPLFLRMLESPDADVRAYAARGTGFCDDPSLAIRLAPLMLPGDPRSGGWNPPHVRAMAALAAGNLRSPDSVAAIDAALAGEPIDDEHPWQQLFAIQAATTLGNIGTSAVLPVLARLLQAPEAVADSAIVALASALRSDPDRFFALSGDPRPSTPPARRAWARALAELGGPRAIAELKSMLVELTGESAGMDSALVLPTVLTSLAHASAPHLQEILAPFLASHDGVFLRAAVTAYGAGDGRTAPWDPIVRAYRNTFADGDPETKVTILNALEPWGREAGVQVLLRQALTDSRRNARIAAARLLRLAGASDVPDDPGPSETTVGDLEYTILAGSRKDRTVAVIETTRGPIEIELFREDAPLTVANFVSLSKGGFFNGLSFMRVVPFFVIQGGDPRNDQEGGPGYTIRCEINLHPFERGSVGMALAGKDTGGSQFFITLAPQPHLDGGYTNFGRVISGMQTADRIVPGDRIVRVSIEEDKTALDYRRY